MAASSAQEITRLLLAWSDGDQKALERLAPLVYEELHRLARGYMCGERPGHVLQTTALIHEAFLRVIDWKNVRWRSRAHFYGVAAQLMRRILVDYARSRNYAKRGGSVQHFSLDEEAIVSEERSEDFMALDDALMSLEKVDARKSQIVELRYFGGLTVEETADVLKVSPRTVMREWSLTRAWLYRELSRVDEHRA